MNRKFSTLLAGILSAFVFCFSAMATVTAGSDVTTTLTSGNTYLLGSSTGYLSVDDGTNYTTTGISYGTLVTVSSFSDLSDVLAASWTVTTTTSTSGTIYTFVNKLTGMTLAVDPSTWAEKTATTDPIVLGGSVTEWGYDGTGFYSYYGSDSVVWMSNISTSSPYVEFTKGTKSEYTQGSVATAGVYETSGTLVLTANDLNTMLLSSSASGFTLEMSPEVSSGFTNPFTENTLYAVGIDGTYVRLEDRTGTAVTYTHPALQVSTTSYPSLTVDTAYYSGTENSGEFLTYTFDYPTPYYEAAGKAAQLRDSLSAHFKFEYNVTYGLLYVSVEEVVHQLEISDSNNDGISADEYGDLFSATSNTYGSFWPTSGAYSGTTTTITASGTSYTNISSEQDVYSDLYLYMAQLVGTNVLTVYDDDYDASSATNGKGQNVTITMSTSYSGKTLTTLASGIYTIQNLGVSGIGKGDYVGMYAIANLGGEFGWAEQATRQDYSHMPAAQWVVSKLGTSSTAAISLVNREFAEIAANTNTDVFPTATLQLYSNSAGVYYLNGTKAVYVNFTAVSDPELTDGYLYLSEEETSVQTYTFNYLHGLSLSTYLTTTDDGYVQVNADGEKTNYRLNIVVKDDNYGVGDSLIRNVYTIEDMSGAGYLTYSDTDNKYVIGEEPGYFFLKENNCIDGTHYYTLVEAQLLYIDGAATYYDAAYAGQTVTYSGTTPSIAAVASGTYTLAYDKNGYPIVADYALPSIYVYAVSGTTTFSVTLQDLTTLATSGATLYAASSASEVSTSTSSTVTITVSGTTTTVTSTASTDYASVKASVDDNTLYLVEGVLKDKFSSEARTSAFAVAVDDSPLYRRFNNADLGEDANDGEVSLAFVESIRGEYLMDEWNANLDNDSIDYAGIWDSSYADGKLFFHVDTAWLNRKNGTIKPQYLISVARNDQSEVETVPCTEESTHVKLNADGTYEETDDPYECIHATTGRTGFIYGKYLVNLSDSAYNAYAAGDPNPYIYTTTTAAKNSYTRVGFVPAIHYGDSLIILVNGYEDKDPSSLNPTTIISAYTKAGATQYIVDLTGDEHKNVTWSFRYVDPDAAGYATEEGTDNAFMFESNVYGDDDNDYQTVYGDVDKAIAPTTGAAWLKMHNGCLVITDATSTFSSAKTGGDGALIFNVATMSDGDDYVTSTEEIAVEGVTVVAGTGVVTIKGAAGKSVVITNILGKAVASTTLTSDSQTISVPAGIVVVAVEGEDAVKTIVK